MTRQGEGLEFIMGWYISTRNCTRRWQAGLCATDSLEDILEMRSKSWIYRHDHH
jgi:hypothetical protein